MGVDKKFIVVLGDSQIRALSYSDFMLPLWLGPANFNNFLTETRSEYTRKKIHEVLECFDYHCDVLFFLSGDVLHHCKNTHETKKATDLENRDFIVSVAHRYFQLICEVQAKLQGTLMVSSSIPSFGSLEYVQLGRWYNETLQKLCLSRNIFFVDIWEKLALEGITKQEFRANGDHINHQALPVFLEAFKKNTLLPDETKINHFEFSYLYRIPFLTGECKIWGDHPKESLIVEDGENYWWTRYQERTRKTLACVKEINRLMEILYNKMGRKLDVLILSAKECFVPFLLEHTFLNSITASEENLVKVEYGKTLLRMFKPKQEIRIILSREYFDFQRLGTFDCVIELGKFNYFENFRKSVFDAVAKQTDYFFFFSFDPKVDSRNILKCSFRSVFHVPFSDENLRTLNDKDNDSLLLAERGELHEDLKKYLNKRHQKFLKTQREKFNSNIEFIEKQMILS